MVKEKIIFWPLLAVFIGIVAFGFFSQGSKDTSGEDLLQELELTAKKAKSKNKNDVSVMKDIDKLKIADTLDSYTLLLKRSPFFKVRPKVQTKVTEPILVKKIAKQVVLKYKGRVIMGSNVMVIIEDQGTGKSTFVKEGDKVGDFEVLSIDEARVVLKKKGGEEIILSATKKQEENKE